MSIFYAMTGTCSTCGDTFAGDVVASVNADRRPDLRDDILDGRFQTLPCPGCGTQVRLPPSFVYLDFGRGQWILASPSADLADWGRLETDARTIFDGAFGSGAPQAARELGSNVRPRITFGWPALREKLLCREHELDEVTIELLKAAIIREGPSAPVSDDTELRLDQVDKETITLCWFTLVGETPLAVLRLPRALHDAMLEPDPAWAPLRHELASNLFVDLDRFTVREPVGPSP